MSIFQKKHVNTMDALKKKHLEEKEQLMSQTESLTKVPRGVTPVAGQVRIPKLFMVIQQVTTKLECFENVPNYFYFTLPHLLSESLFGGF